MFFTNDFSRVELVRKRTHMKMFASFVRCPFTTFTKVMKADISRSKSHKTYDLYDLAFFLVRDYQNVFV